MSYWIRTSERFLNAAGPRRHRRQKVVTFCWHLDYEFLQDIPILLFSYELYDTGTEILTNHCFATEMWFWCCKQIILEDSKSSQRFKAYWDMFFEDLHTTLGSQLLSILNGRVAHQESSLDGLIAHHVGSPFNFNLTSCAIPPSKLHIWYVFKFCFQKRCCLYYTTINVWHLVRFVRYFSNRKCC